MAHPLKNFKPRATLTEDQAVDIFKIKSSVSSAVKVSLCYGVSEKAIRDIWRGRTWSRETCHLDTVRTVTLKQVGRPKGCKDKKPRKKCIIVSTNPDPTYLGASFSQAIEGTPGSKDQKQSYKNLNISIVLNDQGMSYSPRESSWMKQTLTEGYISSFCIDSQQVSFPNSGVLVDNLLDSWDELHRIDPQQSDPFRFDWKPMTCQCFWPCSTGSCWNAH
jgi:hypothetical protein